MIESILTFLSAGFVFGFSGGISPGPTMTLVITQALRHNWKEGAKIALAPLITDGPIILIGVFFLSFFQEFKLFLGVISLLGACFLLYLSYESWTIHQIEIKVETTNPRSLFKGALANALNPSPYLFWFTIGCPTILKALKVGPGAIAAFLVSFFLGLVGTKVFVAILVAPFRRFLQSQGYVYLMRFLGLLLFVYALFYLRDSLKAFGLW